jgi:hypothetical protein
MRIRPHYRSASSMNDAESNYNENVLTAMQYLMEGLNWLTRGGSSNQHQPERHFHHDAMCNSCNVSWRIHFIIHFIHNTSCQETSRCISLLVLPRNQTPNTAYAHIWTRNKNYVGHLW